MTADAIAAAGHRRGAPIRIVYLIGTLERGGAEGQLAELASGLDRARFEPTVCCLAGDGPLAAVLVARGVPVESIGPPAALARLLALPRLWRVLRRLRPDIVHGQLYWGNVAAGLGGRLAGVPAVVGSRLSLARPRGGMRGGLRRLANTRTDLVIANARAVRNAAMRDEGLPDDRVIVIHNGVDCSRFDVAPDPGLRHALGVAASSPIVTVVANLRRSKGHATFLEAWPAVLGRWPEARALLVGDGPLRDAVRARVVALGVTDSVRLLGSRHDVPALLALSQVVAQPSLREGLPNAVLEAMAAGRPVVATDVGGTREAIDHERTGLLVPSGDTTALAAGLVRLLSNPDEAQGFGQAARRHVAEHFQIQTMVRAHEAVYDRVLFGAGAPERVRRATPGSLGA
jgi:glycosyltransferase involved in cell wall biosynthesis